MKFLERLIDSFIFEWNWWSLLFLSALALALVIVQGTST